MISLSAALLLFVLLICTEPVNGLNILQIFPGMSQSHVIFNHKLADTLHRAGHNVTILNMVWLKEKLGDKKPPKGVVEIRVEPDYPPGVVEEMNLLMADYAFNPMTSNQMTKLNNNFNNLTSYLCQYTVNQADLLITLKDNNYDVTLANFFNLCPVGLHKMLNIPKFIWLAPGTFIMDHAADIMSLSYLMSYIPYSGGDFSDRMTFLERLKNFVLVSFNLAMSRTKMSTFYYENQCFKKFPNREKFPDLLKLAENTQGLLVNGEDFLDFPRPITHGLVHIGELGHKNAGELPEEWKSVMDASTNGVILFSLGTVVNTTLMPMKLKDAFLNAFSNFNNYTIIWRLEGEMPQGLAGQKHIKIVTWAPQKELLNHPKFRLFITHGGYNSLLETAQAGVPMILMPLFYDQYSNAHRAVRRGLGLILNKLNADSIVIRNIISEVLNDKKYFNNNWYLLVAGNNEPMTEKQTTRCVFGCLSFSLLPKYRENAKKFSTILQDKFISNEISTVKFIEKIVRTKNWPTMKMAQRLNFFQYYCLDVITLMLLSFLLIFYASLKMFREVLRFLKKFK